MADKYSDPVRCLIIFVKHPEPGKVKTRLASVVGDEPACELYKCFVLDLLENLGEAGLTFPFSIRIYYHPSSTRNKIRNWLGHGHAYAPQTGRTLGARMRNAFKEVFAEGADHALLIGSDLPDLPSSFVKKGFSFLSRAESVIGPSHDGGYYLIGFTADGFLAEAFDGIPWSSSLVFEKTRRELTKHHHKAAVLPLQRDIDTIEDLEAFLDRNRGGGFAGSRTMLYLSKCLKP